MNARRYEGQVILNTAGREDNVNSLVDAIEQEIRAAGGKIETTQKMDKRPFARVTDRKTPSGYYVNFIFSGTPAVLATLRARFALRPDLYRVLFTLARPPEQTKLAA